MIHLLLHAQLLWVGGLTEAVLGSLSMITSTACSLSREVA
jgi:hypothetical protein